jgi:hypothetical protein
MTFELSEDEPVAPARARWPLAVGAVLLFGVGGVAAALLIGRGGDEAEAVTDASLVAEMAPDAAVVIDVAFDAGDVVVAEDAGAPIADGGRTTGPRNPNRDAGPVVAIDLRDGGVIGRSPAERGNVVIEVITRPDDGILYIDQSYRGPGGTHLEERRGARMKVKCTRPGYDPGYIDLVFDGKTEVAVCIMNRTVRCVPGIKNPFDDCPD